MSVLYKHGHEQKALNQLREEDVVTQDSLVSHLWPGKPPAHPHKAISHVISRLRSKGFTIEHKHILVYHLKP